MSEFAPAWLMPARTASGWADPLLPALHADQVRKLFRGGISKSEIARRLNIGRTSVRRVLSSEKS